MDIFTLIIIAVGVIFVYVSILFFISIIIKRNDIADIAWGPGIAIVALTAYFTHKDPDISTLFLTATVFLWALRLAIRIGIRNAKKSEDPRYAQWRSSWGKWFYVRSYGQVYLLQGILMVFMGYPLLHIAAFDSPMISSTFFIGLTMWICGFIFEIISDYQLDQFIQNPINKGKIMQQGLWKYSRHPNYFGEVLLWWGLWIAISPASYSFIALISPLLITFLILKVSGIPMAEKHMEKNPEFQEYKKRTSVFIPLPQNMRKNEIR